VTTTRFFSAQRAVVLADAAAEVDDPTPPAADRRSVVEKALAPVAAPSTSRLLGVLILACRTILLDIRGEIVTAVCSKLSRAIVGETMINNGREE